MLINSGGEWSLADAVWPLLVIAFVGVGVPLWGMWTLATRRWPGLGPGLEARCKALENWWQQAKEVRAVRWAYGAFLIVGALVWFTRAAWTQLVLR